MGAWDMLHKEVATGQVIFSFEKARISCHCKGKCQIVIQFKYYMGVVLSSSCCLLDPPDALRSGSSSRKSSASYSSGPSLLQITEGPRNLSLAGMLPGWVIQEALWMLS